VDRGYKAATDILAGNRETLKRIAEALLEREVLDANELKLLIEGKDLPKFTPRSDDEGVQQVLKPEPARAPGMAPGQQPA
jgi:cell division protease FtsH